MSKARSTRKSGTHERGKTKRSLLFLILLLLAVVVVGYVASQPAKPATVGVGDVAPDFELQVVGANGLTGETVKLSSLRGKVVLLEFMVSWCSTCQNMAPAIETLWEMYDPRGAVFISVAGNYRGADEKSTAAFIRDYGTSWTHVFDAEDKVFPKYSVEATPTYFIIDREGRIVSNFQGVATTEAFSSALDSAL
jgi:peroxiredoxin